jgi:stage II sporulation protein D
MSAGVGGIEGGQSRGLDIPQNWRGRARAMLLTGAAVLSGLVASTLGGCSTIEKLPNPLEETYQGPKVAGMFRDEPDIRVRILKGISTVEVGGPGRVVVRQVGASVGSPSAMTPPIKVSSGAAGVSVSDAGGAKRDWPFGTNIEIVPMTAENTTGGTTLETAVRVNGTAYPGIVSVQPRWSSAPNTFDVVMSMGIESYLPGVLTHELFKDWPRQTYEAQSVAARTYAIHERSRARGENRAFDVEDTEADQVFGGLAQSTKANEATRATRGMVITNNGRLVRAYYSSTCGGRPASAATTWPIKPDRKFNKDSVLQAKQREHACQNATFYRWTVKRSGDDLSQRVRAWGRRTSNDIAQLGRIREVTVKEFNKGGRPDQYIVTDERGGEYQLSAEELREACNEAVSGLAPITRENRVHSGDLTVRVWASEVEISGRGWGHAVGMCQWCAKGFADLGWDWRKMIGTFYPESSVEKAY